MREMRSPTPVQNDGASVIASPAPEDRLSTSARTWLLISRYLLILTYVCGAAMSGWVIYALNRRHTENHEFAFAIAAIFVGITVPISLHNMNMHMMHYVSPMQAHVLRIIWMVPIYSVQSWIALVYRASAPASPRNRRARRVFPQTAAFRPLAPAPPRRPRSDLLRSHARVLRGVLHL
jgi:hypothetical protein